MANNWTSVLDIMRDLSMVQGSGVPANIGQTLGTFDRPLTPDLSEEEEHHGISTVDFEYPAPDLGLIKEMLNLVRDNDSSSDERSQCDIQISKRCNERKASKQTINTLIGIDTTAKRKPNKRNVALTSILQIQSQAEKPLKLLKPDDFVSPDVEESVEKVNGWFDAQTSTKEKNKKTVVLEAGIMFKKKTPVKKTTTTKEESPSQISEVKTNSKYEPSEYALELYNELMEKKRLKTMVQEDIWSRAERQMKEIEEKKKQEALKSPLSDVASSKSQCN